MTITERLDALDRSGTVTSLRELAGRQDRGQPIVAYKGLQEAFGDEVKGISFEEFLAYCREKETK